jgi:hypothetical protein
MPGAYRAVSTKTHCSRSTERRIRFYPADDMGQHLLNAASIETSRVEESKVPKAFFDSFR